MVTMQLYCQVADAAGAGTGVRDMLKLALYDKDIPPPALADPF